jgi:UDP-2-acetamido-2-deoxy-ribo-hexuluronate aminotransferase
MNSIQLVDLSTQYKRIENEVNDAILQVVKSGNFIGGPEVKTFADNLTKKVGAKHVIPCANGTDALQIALMACDLQPGDEVITPSYTYIATAEVIALLNLKPVFIEVNENNFTLDVDQLEKVITPKTKAIIPVHLYGQCANMERVLDFAKKHNLFVIEDTAQAINTTYTFSDGTTKTAGTMGTIGTTSFFPSKNLGAFGDAGAIFTNDDELATKIKMVANHGQKIKYHHELIGCNSRLDTIQAAVLDVKLKYLDEYIKSRQDAADFYNSHLNAISELQTPFVESYSNHTYHQYTMVLKTPELRDGLMEFLKLNGVPCNIYYPIPIHKQKGFQKFEVNTDLSKTEDLCSRVLSLPMHTELAKDQLEYIVNKVKEFFKK